MIISQLEIAFPVRSRTPSLLSARVADLFGIAADERPRVVARAPRVEFVRGSIALLTGPSGSGKSSLLRAYGERLGARDVRALNWPETTLIDAMPGELRERLDLLASCGLAEARVLLRTPGELSDGQRERFRVAFALARAEPGDWLLIDEFAAVLERDLARVLAFNLRNLSRSRHVGFLLATTHDDCLEDLQPELHIHCRGEGLATIQTREVKKNGSACSPSAGCPGVPSPIGRTSLGGIIAADGRLSSGK